MEYVERLKKLKSVSADNSNRIHTQEKEAGTVTREGVTGTLSLMGNWKSNMEKEHTNLQLHLELLSYG